MRRPREVPADLWALAQLFARDGWALAELDAALGLEALPPGADIDERLQRETTRRARLVAAIRSLTGG